MKGIVLSPPSLFLLFLMLVLFSISGSMTLCFALCCFGGLTKELCAYIEVALFLVLFFGVLGF